MRRLIESRIGILLMALALVFVLGSIASACPTCSEALEKQDPSHGGIVKGYFYSILFMMGTPYLIFGTFCGAMYFQVRRATPRGSAQAIARRGAPTQRTNCRRRRSRPQGRAAEQHAQPRRRRDEFQHRVAELLRTRRLNSTQAERGRESISPSRRLALRIVQPAQSTPDPFHGAHPLTRKRGQGVEHLPVVAGHLHGLPDLGDLAVAVDQEGRALDAEEFLAVHVFLPPRAVALGHFVVDVGQQGKIQLEFVAKPAVTLDRVGADAEDFGAEFGKIRPAIAKVQASVVQPGVSSLG